LRARDREAQIGYQRKHYEANRPALIAKARERKKETLNRFREYKKGLSCSICGENHPATLDFHHKNAEDKEVSVSQAVANGWTWNRILKEIEKCDVLCSNCHRKIHWEEENAGMV